jgi:hypothetical protein
LGLAIVGQELRKRIREVPFGLGEIDPKLMNLLINSSGQVMRYNRPGPSGQKYNVPTDKEWGASRDQTMPIVLALLLLGDKTTAQRIWRNVKQNWFRFPNGDLCGCDDWLIFQLAIGNRPIKFLGESQLWIAVLDRINKANKDPDDVGDDILLTQKIAVLSCYGIGNSRQYYANYRPAYFFKGGNFRDKNNYEQRPGENGIQYSFDHYCREGNPYHELWRPIISNIFRKTNG